MSTEPNDDEARSPSSQEPNRFLLKDSLLSLRFWPQFYIVRQIDSFLHLSLLEDNIVSILLFFTAILYPQDIHIKNGVTDMR